MVLKARKMVPQPFCPEDPDAKDFTNKTVFYVKPLPTSVVASILMDMNIENEDLEQIANKENIEAGLRVGKILYRELVRNPMIFLYVLCSIKRVENYQDWDGKPLDPITDISLNGRLTKGIDEKYFESLDYSTQFSLISYIFSISVATEGEKKEFEAGSGASNSE